MAGPRQLIDRISETLTRWGEHPYPTAVRQLCEKPRVAQAAMYLAIAACTIAALAPVFAAKDLPLIDLPAHMGAIHIWNNYDDAAGQYKQYYDLNIQPAPYWVFYGFVHYASYIMPLRWACKLFVILSIVAMPLGLAALIRANKGPAILGLAGYVMAWGPLMEWGMLANVGSIGPLLFAYALLATMANTERPGWKLWAGNAAMGVFLQFSHPIAFILWLGGILVYTRGKHLLIVAPAVALFLFQFTQSPGGKPHPQKIIVVQGMWKTPGANLKHFYDTQLVGYFARGWQFWFALCSLTTLAGGLLLGIRTKLAEGQVRDRRPLYLFGVVIAAYFFLPYHLQKPVGFAGMNTRVPPVLVLVGFSIIAHRKLGGWRTAAVCAPIVALAISLPIHLYPKFANFGRGLDDFYTVVDKLPKATKVATLIYKQTPRGLYRAWQKYPCYVLVEKGGYQPCLWEPSQGIGAMAFPAGYKKGRRIPGPPMGAVRAFKWHVHAKHYDYFLTRGEPANLFSRRKQLELVEHRGEWRLWKKKSAR